VFDEATAALIEMAMNEPSTNGDLQGQALAYASEAFSMSNRAVRSAPRAA
jgi:hypothetical protein